MKVKYRNGYPTKKSLIELVSTYCEIDKRIWKLHIGYNNRTFIWQCHRVEEVILDFIDWATNNHDITFGKFDNYKSPTVGHLHINSNLNQN